MRRAIDAGDRGAIVRLARRTRGWTQSELGDRCGYSASTISRLETGGQELSNIDLLQKLAAILAIPPRLLGLAGDVEPPRRLRTAGTVPAQLPPNVRDFAGRSTELDRLDALIVSPRKQAPAVVISAVSGTAGVGKTALAVHWAHRVASRFPDGQLYVNLRGFDPTGTPMDPAEAVRGFLDAFGVAPERIPVDLAARAALYRSLLAGKRVLVVLDNARDVDQARPLLPGSPGCLAVVTSRNDLAGLVAKEGAQPLTLDLFTKAEAHLLLRQRIGTERVLAEPDAVEDIIAACDRLPLALAVVAARAATHPRFPLQALANELRDTRLDTLASAGQDTAVRDVFSWSYTQLSPPAAQLFRLLGLHPGPDISIPAAASLIGLPVRQSKPLLAELTHTNLIAEQPPGRYAFHDLLRAYATDLAHTDDTETVRHDATGRMLDHYVHTAFAGDRMLDPDRDPIKLASPADGVTLEQLADSDQAMAWFSTERPVLLAVLRAAVNAELDTYAWQLAWGTTTFLTWQGHKRDAMTAAQVALTAAERMSDLPAQARAHRYLARAYHWFDHLADARRHLQRSLELSTASGDHAGQAHTYTELAMSFVHEDDYAKALEYTRRALDLFQESGNQGRLAHVHNLIGWCYSQLGDHEQALSWCEQALAKYQLLRDHHGEADTWDSLGYSHHHLGHYEIALDCYQHALSLYPKISDRYSVAVTVTHLGDTQHATGDTEAARHSWRQALMILTDLDHPDAEKIRAKLSSLERPSTS